MSIAPATRPCVKTRSTWHCRRARSTLASAHHLVGRRVVLLRLVIVGGRLIGLAGLFVVALRLVQLTDLLLDLGGGREAAEVNVDRDDLLVQHHRLLRVRLLVAQGSVLVRRGSVMRAL